MNSNETSEREKRDRVLLIYIAGDNNLSGFGLLDIEELCKEGYRAHFLEIWKGAIK